MRALFLQIRINNSLTKTNPRMSQSWWSNLYEFHTYSEDRLEIECPVDLVGLVFTWPHNPTRIQYFLQGASSGLLCSSGWRGASYGSQIR